MFYAFKCCELLSPSHESAVLTMVRPASTTQTPKATRSICTLITSHDTRLMKYGTQQRQQKQTCSRRESALIKITRLPKHAIKNKSTPLRFPRVLCSNVRSITKSKYAELVQQSVDYDIIMISESRLKPHKKAAFMIQNFKMLSDDRSEKQAGGVCMYIRDSLSTTIVDEFTSQDVSSLLVPLHQENQSRLIYACVYHRPTLPKAIC